MISGTANRIVVALIDRRRVKGWVYSFNPNSPVLQVFPTQDADRGYAQHLELGHCKAVFFVRSHEGNRDYRENKTSLSGVRRRGLPIEILFKDGERLVGFTEAYNPNRLGFFMFPPDPRSNNIRIFVVNAAVQEVRTGKDVARGGERSIDERIVRARPADSPGPPPPAAAGTAGAASPHGPVVAPTPRAPSPDIESSLAARDIEKFPVQRRVAAVLRLLGGEDPDAVANDVLVPVEILSFWRERFLEAGSRALSGSGDEARDRLVSVLRARVQELEDELSAVHGVVKALRRDG